MTNEELATAIQKGRADLIARLWDQVEAFIRYRARSAMNNIPASHGVTEEDFLYNNSLVRKEKHA